MLQNIYRKCLWFQVKICKCCPTCIHSLSCPSLTLLSSFKNEQFWVEDNCYTSCRIVSVQSLLPFFHFENIAIFLSVCSSDWSFQNCDIILHYFHTFLLCNIFQFPFAAYHSSVSSQLSLFSASEDKSRPVGL